MQTPVNNSVIWAWRIGLVVTGLSFWEYGSGRWFSPLFASRPSLIVAQFWEWLTNGVLLHHATITVVEAVSGFIAGGTAGFIAGILMGRSQTIAGIFNPLITMFYSLPKVALAPLFILWFGIGIEMKIYLTAVIVFFLVFLNTYTGARSVDTGLVDILRLMGAKRHHITLKVVVPSAITWVFAGLRLSVPYALIGAIVGELIASNRGLGFLLSHAAGQFDTTGVFASLLVIIFVAMIINGAVKLLERIAMPWEHQKDNTVSI